MILPVAIQQPKYSPPCSDRVLLLSEDEVIRCLPEKAHRQARPSAGNDQPYSLVCPKAVFHNGNIQSHSRNAYHTDFTLRPCILVDCKAYQSALSNSGNTGAPALSANAAPQKHTEKTACSLLYQEPGRTADERGAAPKPSPCEFQKNRLQLMRNYVIIVRNYICKL